MAQSRPNTAKKLDPVAPRPPIVSWPGSTSSSVDDPHQLVAFGKKYPASQNWNTVGFPTDFFIHCWVTLSHQFATGIPSEHKTPNPASSDLCNTPIAPSNITVPPDGPRKDWNTWQSVDYQTVQDGFMNVNVQTGSDTKKGNTAHWDKPSEFIPRRWFARCRGRNDFLANVYHHLNGLFEKVRKGEIIEKGEDNKFVFKPISLDLQKYLDDDKKDGTPGRDAILGSIGVIWADQDKQAEGIQHWASYWCRELGVRQCQTMDAIFLNGVSGLLTVYKAHALLYETLEVPTTEDFRDRCDLKTVKEQKADGDNELDIHIPGGKKRKCNVGPVIQMVGRKEQYDEPDEPGLNVFSL